ncbi:hypothetical protein [Shewanella maritima]|uniref:hypothetical protein n=1 Tax=Shewanella maritima TaxID=2520507 RepID=UPI003735FB3C
MNPQLFELIKKYLLRQAGGFIDASRQARDLGLSARYGHTYQNMTAEVRGAILELTQYQKEASQPEDNLILMLRESAEENAHQWVELENARAANVRASKLITEQEKQLDDSALHIDILHALVKAGDLDVLRVMVADWEAK